MTKTTEALPLMEGEFLRMVLCQTLAIVKAPSATPEDCTQFAAGDSDGKGLQTLNTPGDPRVGLA